MKESVNTLWSKPQKSFLWPQNKAKEAVFLVVICNKKDMPGVRGPSEYSQEPSRDPSLKVNAKASTSFFFAFAVLIQFWGWCDVMAGAFQCWATSLRLSFILRHSRPSFLQAKPWPHSHCWSHRKVLFLFHLTSSVSFSTFAFCLILDSLFPLTSYSVSVTGLIDNPTKLFIKDIKSLPKFNVTATLQCAGNRRTAMSKVRNVRGVGWDVSAIGNGSFFLSPKIYLFFFYNTKTV